MTVVNLDGQPDLSKVVQYSDIPSDLNQVYRFGLNEDGGLTDGQGKGSDPVPLSDAIPDQDTVTIPKNYTKLILVVAAGLILFSILRK
jgi:hypothetical protein